MWVAPIASSAIVARCVRCSRIALLFCAGLLALMRVAVAQEIWIGTAPFCKGEPSDCTARGMDYVRSDRRGDGKACRRGQKVLCRPRGGTAANSSEFWIGTPPFCNGQPADCAARGLDYVRSEPRDCRRGQKVLCRQRVALPESQKAPFYIIAHASNTPAKVEDALRLGANALELDVHYNRATRRIEVFHGGLLDGGAPGIGENRVSLDAILQTVVNARRRYPGLALLIFDFKEHNGEQQALLILRNSVRAALSGAVPYIISINKFEKFPLVESLVRLGGPTPLSSGEGLAIDEENSPADVGRRLKSLGLDRIAYGNGIDVKLGNRPSIPRSIRQALDMKRSSRAFRLVYVWTLRKDDSFRDYLQDGIDAIFVNPNNIGNLRNAFLNFAATRRLATGNDNPFR